MFPSPYVAAADLRGQPLAVTIDRIVHEVVDPATGEKAYICYFAGYKRGLRLNKINARTIGKIHGVEALGWSGKVIELYPTLTTMKGEEVDCIRVRASAQAAAPVATLPAHDAGLPWPSRHNRRRCRLRKRCRRKFPCRHRRSRRA
jgi:hypothetical protein